MTHKIQDGLLSLTNTLINERHPELTNYRFSLAMDCSQQREWWRSGIGSKIVRIKSSYALENAFQFEDDEQEAAFERSCERAVKQAVRYMVGFGRGLAVLVEPGVDLSKPKPPNARQLAPGWRWEVFSGDMVSVGVVETDLLSRRYLRPKTYSVRGNTFHHTRCVDFRYLMAAEEEQSKYNYGGISEFELIREQLVADGIIQRAGPTIVEKNATMFYKFKGFNEALEQGLEDFVKAKVQAVEKLRSIYGAGVVDAEDDITVVNQVLQSMANVDTFTLRRLAMVTGIPLALLVGENVRGLNSTGEQERRSFQDMLAAVRYDYIIEPVQDMARMVGLGTIELNSGQIGTPQERAEMESKVLANARVMYDMGEDYRGYLADFGLVQPDEIPEDDEMVSAAVAAPVAEPDTTPGPAGEKVKDVALNGAQVTSLMQVIQQVATGQLPRESALGIIRVAFGLSQDDAESMLGPVGLGFKPEPLTNE